MSALRDLIHEVMDSTDLSDPQEVAAEVLARLRGPGKRVPWDVLAEALPVFVRVSFSRSRMLGVPGDSPAPARSAKVAGVRDAWARRLETPVFTGAGWKRLAECSAADLQAVAGLLRSHAEQSVAKAEWYEALAARVPSGGVVGDLATDPLAVAA